jgi:glutamate synthase domain-containing protein 2
MSYGALSKNAVLALNLGAKRGGFAQDTGEGGLSPYHLEHGADIIWEVGTGYFGCRHKDGTFDPIKFRDKAQLPQVKMLEIKLSQGAKPGHGGILPAAKLTREIAEIRGVEMSKDVLSPPAHSAFSTPLGLVEFVQKLRELADGKPVGIKFCLGKRREFIAICKAMMATKITPDFIVIDGGEGGTGAAPLEFSNYVGSPLRDALVFVHNCLVGFDLRKDIRLMVSGKIVTGFDIVDKIALGADICNAARAMMMALGCIQALRCQTNRCPTGVATQDAALVKGLVVDDKATRVYNYHQQNVKNVAEIIGAMGLAHSHELRPWHVLTRITQTKTLHYGELYHYLEAGALLGKDIPPDYARAFYAARPDSWYSPADKKLVVAR